MNQENENRLRAERDEIELERREARAEIDRLRTALAQAQRAD